MRQTISSISPQTLVNVITACGSETDASSQHDLIPGTPLKIESKFFKGTLVLHLSDWIQEITNDTERPDQSSETPIRSDDPYFQENPERTFSISIHDAMFVGSGPEGALPIDDIWFGNVLHQPVRDRLPYGTSLVLKFAKAIDAAITYDVEADHPWAFSPLLATVNTLRVKSPVASSDATSSIDSLSVKEDTDLLAEIGADPGMKAGQRRSFFAKDSNRKLMISPDKHRVSCDFYNSWISVSKTSSHLNLPIGLKFDLKRYWDLAPVQYVCRSKDASRTFFEITFIAKDQ